MQIWNVNEETRLKMKLLCAGRNLSMAKLLESIVEKEWLADDTEIGKLEKNRMRRIINKFGK